MSDCEHRLECLWGYGDTRLEAGGGSALADVLWRAGVLSAQRRDVWRARFARLERGERKPEPDPVQRERCLEVLEAAPPEEADHLAYVLREANLITAADRDHFAARAWGDELLSTPANPLVAARVGPLRNHGLEVIWVADHERTIQIAWRTHERDISPEAVHLADDHGTVFTSLGYSSGNRWATAEFSPRPRGRSWLVHRDERVPLP